MKKILIPALAAVCFVAGIQAQTVSTVITDGTDEPFGVAVDLSTNAYYFTDSVNNRVMSTDSGGLSATVIVDGDVLLSGPLNNPQGLAWGNYGGSDGLIIADTGNHVIRFANATNGALTTIAGGLGSPANVDATGTSARFAYPYAVAADTLGNFYVADTFNNSVRSISPVGVVQTITNGFSRPQGIAVGNISIGAGTTNQDLWVADTLKHVIRKIVITRTAGPTVTYSSSIVAGQYGISGTQDGGFNALNALFNQPRGLVWVGGATGLVISDTGNNEIRKLYFDTVHASQRVVTLGGTTAPGLADGPLASASFNSPIGLALDAEGSIILADLKNNAIRKIARVALPTPGTTLTDGTTPVSGGSFSNAVTVVFANNALPGTNTTFHYTVNGSPVTLLSPVAAQVTLDGGTVAVTNVPLQFKSYSPDFNASPAVSNYYNFFVAAPLIFPTGITNGNDYYYLIVSNVTVGANLYYTTNGTEPTTSSTFIGNSISNVIIVKNNNLKIKGFKAGYADSATATYLFNLTVADPVISPANATNNNDVAFFISDTTSNSIAHYTLDGSDPGPGNPASTALTLTNNGFGLFTYSIIVSNNGTLKVRGFKTGYNPSAIVSAVVSLTAATPIISVLPAATNNNTVTVTISSATLNSILIYTTNGSDPSITGSITNGIVLNTNSITLPNFAADCTFKARAIRAGYLDSAIASQIVHLYVSDPLISPPGATNANPVSFFITDATSNSVAYYTMDGSDPGPGNNQSQSVAFNYYTNGLSTNSIIITNNGTLKIRGFRTGFAPSAIVSVNVNLKVATPVITANPSFTNFNDITITVTCATTNPAKLILVTTDGTDPVYTPLVQTNGYYYTVPFTLTTNGTGTIKAKAFLTGFQDSDVASSAYNLFVSNPTLTPNGATNNNDVVVTVTNLTVGASNYWTIDGSDPTPANGTLVAVDPGTHQGALTNSVNGTLKIRGFKSGYTSSAIVSAVFNLSVGAPTLSPGSGTYVDSVTVTNTSTTTNRSPKFYYTVDSTSPTTSSLFLTNGGTLVIKTNTVLTIFGFLDGYASSPVIVGSYLIKVATPTVSPSGGYFPSGATVTFSDGAGATNHLITNSLAIVPPRDVNVYYTVSGTTPTTNDTFYGGPFNIDQLSFPNSDLRILSARAFAPNCLPSDVVQGQTFPTNQIGVPADLVAGAGSKVIIPVVVNLKTNVDLRSLQFRLEITNVSPSTNVMSSLLANVNVQTNDFVPVVGNFDGTVNNYTNLFYLNGSATKKTNGLVYGSIATNLFIRNFGVVMNVKVPIPANAQEGDKFSVRVLEVSGTSDGAQGTVTLTPMTNRIITVSNLHYVIGGTAPGRWYNAGDFGSGNLNNADVNNVFKMSAGLFHLDVDTDAFDAMDVYPPDFPPFVGGDKQIRLLDWQYVFDRSLRRRTDNFRRFWAGSDRASESFGLPPSGSARPAGPKTPGAPAPGLVWMRHAKMGAGTLANAAPGGTYNVPIYVDVLPGYSISGFEFRASLRAEGGAPVPTQAPTFIPVGVPGPSALLTDRTNLLCGWLLSSFDPPLTGSNFLGYLQCKLPAGGQSGQHYSVRFFNCDGAPDDSTQYDVESLPGDIALLTSANAPATISDEWKVKFFGNVDSANANPNADPDHDGVVNWKEYVAGTSPTDGQSNLRFSNTVLSGSGVDETVVIRWLSAPGKNYVVETSSEINGGWSGAATVAGDGYVKEVNVNNIVGQAQFFRLRLQP